MKTKSVISAQQRGEIQKAIPADYIRPAAAARMLSIHGRTLRMWMHDRRIPCYRVSSRCVLLKRTDIHSALEQFRVAAVGE